LHRDALWRDPGRVRTVEDWYRLVRDEPLRFDPGTKQEYSNGGYVLLGAIIERVSGEDYYRYIHDHVYAPAGMAASESDLLEDRDASNAIPYTRRRDALGGHGAEPAAGPDGVANPKRLGRGSPAGGGYSTVGDLVRFARAMRSGTLVRGERRLMTDSTGFGVAGGSPGVNALLQVEGPYTLAILSNVDPPSAERFARTTGRMLAEAAGLSGGKRVRVGGGRSAR
jgi:CubicO group peptidase (beta-lactamase class C family)